MVQAWHLYKATMRIRHQQQQNTVESEVEFAVRIRGRPAIEVIQQRKERREKETEARKQRREEKKLEEMPLLDFVREVVEMMINKHSDVGKNISARQSVARLSVRSTQAVQHDHSRPHLITKTTIRGRCKLCHELSFYSL